MVSIVTGYHIHNKHKPKLALPYARLPKIFWSVLEHLTPYYVPDALLFIFVDRQTVPRSVMLRIMSMNGVVEVREGRIIKKSSYLPLNKKNPAKASYYVRIPRRYFGRVQNLVPVFISDPKPVIVITDKEKAEKLVKGELFIDVEIITEQLNENTNSSMESVNAGANPNGDTGGLGNPNGPEMDNNPHPSGQGGGLEQSIGRN